MPGIVSFFPASQCGSILITSRLAGSSELGQSIELDHTEKGEGLQLLLHSPGIDTDELVAAEEILSLLGNLPLAVDQARAYISKRPLGLRAFVTEYERRKQSVMQETPQIWQYRRMLLGEEKEISLSLLTTWEMSLQLLDVGEEAEELEKVITLFAFFKLSISANDSSLTMHMTVIRPLQCRFSRTMVTGTIFKFEDAGAVVTSIFA